MSISWQTLEVHLSQWVELWVGCQELVMFPNGFFDMGKDSLVSGACALVCL